MKNKEGYYTRLILWCTPILFFIWNYIGLTQNCLAGDEPFSYYFAEQSYTKIIRELLTGNNPPLYEISLHSYTLVFGPSIFKARLLSLIFTSGAVFFTVKTANYFFGFKQALVTAILLLGSNYLLGFSHEIRGYSLLLLLISAASYFYLSAIKTKAKLHFIALVLLNTLMLYTHYLSVFVIFCQFITLLIWKKDRLIHLKKYLLYHIGAIILALPIIINLFSRFKQTEGGKTWLTSPESIVDIYNMIWKFSNKPFPTVLILGLFTIGLLQLFRVKKLKFNFPTIHLWLSFPFLFLLIFIISFKVPLFLDRYLSIVILSFYLFVAHILVVTFRSKTMFIVSLSVLSISFLVTKKIYVDNNRHLDVLTQKVKDLREEGQKIIVSDLQLLPAMSYYFDSKNYFKQTIERSELIQRKSLEEANIFFTVDFKMETKNPKDLILIEGGEQFTNKNSFNSVKNIEIQVIEVPEIYKIITFKNQNIKSETQ